MTSGTPFNPSLEPIETSERAAHIARGVVRHFFELGLSCVAELSLANGRRADIAALSAGGLITIIEIKSGQIDFQTDTKWHEYRPYCDRFYFAVDRDFPAELIPPNVGLIIADKYGAAVLREAIEEPLPAARRKAMTLRIAHLAAGRLMRAMLLQGEL